MRVVLFTRHFVEYTLRYAEGLSTQCEVIVILDAKGRSPKLIESELARKWALGIHAFSLGMAWERLASILRVISILFRFRPDVVHFQEVPDPLTPVVLLLVSLWRPVVLTVHDPAPHSGRDSELSPRVSWLADLGRRRADMLVVHGSFCLRQMKAAATRPQRPIVGSVHGVLMTEAAPLGPDPGTFLFFGRMEAYKGLDVFAGALAILAARGRACRAEIAGRGQELDRLSGPLSLIPGVRVTNRFIADEEAIALFGGAACVVLPYKDATQSGVVAAAYGAGRPVIASAVGGIPEVVIDGFNGILVPPSDPEALADAMEKIILSSELLEILSRGARKTASGLMSWSRIAGTMLESYAALRSSTPAST